MTSYRRAVDVHGPLVERYFRTLAGSVERFELYPRVVDALHRDGQEIAHLFGAVRRAGVGELRRRSILSGAVRQRGLIDEVERTVRASLVEGQQVGGTSDTTLYGAAVPIHLLVPMPVLARLVGWDDATHLPVSRSARVPVPLVAVKRLAEVLASHDWKEVSPTVHSACIRECECMYRRGLVAVAQEVLLSGDAEMLEGEVRAYLNLTPAPASDEATSELVHIMTSLATENGRTDSATWLELAPRLTGDLRWMVEAQVNLALGNALGDAIAHWGDASEQGS